MPRFRIRHARPHPALGSLVGFVAGRRHVLLEGHRSSVEVRMQE